MDGLPVEKSGYKRGFVPFAIAAAVLSLCGGFTAAAPSAIATSWGLGGTGTTWITLAFALSAAGMAPIMGKFGDLMGRRVGILTGLALMAVGEFMIGIAPSGAFAFVLVARFVLGAGAAVIAPVVIGYILTEFPANKTGQGFALYMFIASAMVIFGPTARRIDDRQGGLESSFVPLHGLLRHRFRGVHVYCKKCQRPQKIPGGI